MAIVYSEQFETRKATTNVAGTGANYRIEHIVRNPVGQPINSITATISQVTVEGERDAQTEKLVRVGNACVDVANNAMLWNTIIGSHQACGQCVRGCRQQPQLPRLRAPRGGVSQQPGNHRGTVLCRCQTNLNRG